MENEELAKSSSSDKVSIEEKMSVLSLSETIREKMKDLFPGETDWTLVEEIQTTGLPSSLRCRLCAQPISVPYYAAKRKDDNDNQLKPIGHKVCGDLPMEMEHQLLHPGHTLRKTRRDDSSALFCNSCNDEEEPIWYFRYKSNDEESIWYVYYKCSDCEEFVLGIKCALKLFPINLKCHHHPLIPIHKMEEFHCDACYVNDSSQISYECTTCLSFRVHQYCVSPHIIRLPSHRHDVRLVYSLPDTLFGEPIYCQICRQDMKGGQGLLLAYHCARCRYYFHIYKCRTFQHPSDYFPLLLVEEERAGAKSDSNGSLDCRGCQLKISVPYYLSNKFNVNVLHKFCAELPESVQHHLHPGHDLTLGYFRHTCGACDAPWKGFSYSCRRGSCYFSIDIICALKNVPLLHKFHKHPLIASHGKGLFACRACNKDSDGPSYICTTCRFWVHHQCGSAPMSRKHDMHPHVLKLTHSIQDSSQEEDRMFYCQVCREEMQPHDWAYHCSGCRYYAHVHDCYDPHWNREIEEFDYEAALAASVHLPPVDNESISLSTLFFMDRELNQDTDGIKVGKSTLFLDPDETCHRCAHLLAPPCDNCALCKYFLPKSPAEFDDLISLIRGYYSMLKASPNKTNCNGFGLNIREDGVLLIKISSSVLPRYIKHEGHRHVLITTFVPITTWCSACEGDVQGYAFRCNLCNFTIDTYCATLPGSIRHGYDKKHPFKLTYYSIEGVEEYVCELCEEDITTMWFCHCVECDQSIHPRCIWRYFIHFGPSIDEKLSEKVLVPTTELFKIHPVECLVCDQRDNTWCRYSVVKMVDSGYKSMTHLECGGGSEAERWPDEREDLVNVLVLLSKEEESKSPDSF